MRATKTIMVKSNDSHREMSLTLKEVARCKTCEAPLFNMGEHLIESCGGVLECQECFHKSLVKTRPQSTMRSAA